ncbi:MAG: carboxyl transferase domain-containing protein, partial [Iamia sp.]
MDRPGTAWAGLIEVDGRTAMFIEVGGHQPGRLDGDDTAEAEADAEVVAQGFTQAGELGVPIMGVIGPLAVGPHDLSALAAWGRVARAATAVSGAVPVLLAVTGACHGGLTPLLGLADHVVLTRDASAYVNGPAAVAAGGGGEGEPEETSGAEGHASGNGLATRL